MKKLVTVFIVLAMLVSLSGCKASPREVQKAEDFSADLIALDTAVPEDDIDHLVTMAASIMKIHTNAFDLSDGWENKSEEFEKYIHVFDSSGVLSLYQSYGRIHKVTYTFCVTSKTAVFDAADKLIGLYGEPASIALNSLDSTNKEIKQAIDESADPDLRYCYEWTINIKGKKLYLYLAYYYASDINFTYVVVSD